MYTYTLYIYHAHAYIREGSRDTTLNTNFDTSQSWKWMAEIRSQISRFSLPSEHGCYTDVSFFRVQGYSFHQSLMLVHQIILLQMQLENIHLVGNLLLLDMRSLQKEQSLRMFPNLGIVLPNKNTSLQL